MPSPLARQDLEDPLGPNPFSDADAPPSPALAPPTPVAGAASTSAVGPVLLGSGPSGGLPDGQRETVVHMPDELDNAGEDGAHKAPQKASKLHHFCRELSLTLFGPTGFFKTLPHAFTFVLALGAVACFILALVIQQPLEASVAAVLFLLCWHVIALQNERFYLEHAGGCEAHVSQVLGQFEEMDLAACAKELSVPLGGDAGEDTALGRMLLSVLAKDHLRCLAVLRCYRDAFGPLPEGSAGAAGRAAAGKFPAQGPGCPRQRMPLALSLSEAESGSSAQLPAVTPRSPPGPPSPDTQRRRSRGGGGDAPGATGGDAPVVTLSVEVPASEHRPAPGGSEALQHSSTGDRALQRNSSEKLPAFLAAVYGERGAQQPSMGFGLFNR